MSTATLPGTTASGSINQAASNLREWQVTAESVLERIAKNESVDPAETQVFQLLGWDRRQIRREVGRVTAILAWKAQAKPSSVRSELRERLATKRAEADKANAKREAEIAKLQEAIRADAQEVDGMTQDLRTMDLAVEQLKRKQLLPSFVRDAIDAKRGQVRATVGVEVSQLETRIAFLQKAVEIQWPMNLLQLSLQHPSPLVELVFTFARNLPSSHPGYPQGGQGGFPIVTATGFRQFQNEAEADLEELVPRLADAKARYDAAVATFDTLQNYYVDQLDS